MDSNILHNYNFKANLVCLGIDSLLWVTLAAAFGSFVGHRYYIHGHAIAAFSMVTLMTFVMILLELFGTTKKNRISMVISLLLRSIRWIIGVLAILRYFFREILVATRLSIFTNIFWTSYPCPSQLFQIFFWWWLWHQLERKFDHYNEYLGRHQNYFKCYHHPFYYEWKEEKMFNHSKGWNWYGNEKSRK